MVVVIKIRNKGNRLFANIFIQYLYGRRFPVYAYHQPLVKIFQHQESRPSARLEQWSLRLQPYDLKVCYQSGTLENPSDYLSRHPLSDVRPIKRQDSGKNR